MVDPDPPPAPPAAPPLGPPPAPRGSGGLLTRAAVAGPLVAVAVYVVLALFARGFYGSFHVDLDEVGLGYETVLARAVPAALLVSFALIAAGAYLAADSNMDRALDRIDRLPPRGRGAAYGAIMAAAVTTLTVVVARFPSSVRVAVVVGLVLGAVALAGVARLSRAGAPPRLSGRGRLVAAGMAIAVCSWGATLLGEAIAVKLHRGNSEPPIPGFLLPMRWPTAVQVVGAPVEVVRQEPCLPLLLGSSDSYHVLLERTERDTTVVRIPADGTTLRTVFGHRATRSGRAVVCDR